VIVNFVVVAEIGPAEGEKIVLESLVTAWIGNWPFIGKIIGVIKVDGG